MVDHLGLCDATIPLQDRYDKFVRWISSKNHSVPEILADEIGVTASVVDVFFEIGNLDADEFLKIDNEKIDVGALFIIVRADKNIRLLVYEKIKELLKSPQPLKAIRDFIDSNKVNLEALLHKISANAWASLSHYLKVRAIDIYPTNTGFRSMLMNAKRMINRGDKMSEKMIDWALEAIAYDTDQNLGIFANDTLKKNHLEDFNIFKIVIENINIS